LQQFLSGDLTDFFSSLAVHQADHGAPRSAIECEGQFTVLAEQLGSVDGVNGLDQLPILGLLGVLQFPAATRYATRLTNIPVN